MSGRSRTVRIGTRTQSAIAGAGVGDNDPELKEAIAISMLMSHASPGLTSLSASKKGASKRRLQQSPLAVEGGLDSHPPSEGAADAPADGSSSSSAAAPASSSSSSSAAATSQQPPAKRGKKSGGSAAGSKKSGKIGASGKQRAAAEAKTPSDHHSLRRMFAAATAAASQAAAEPAAAPPPATSSMPPPLSSHRRSGSGGRSSVSFADDSTSSSAGPLRAGSGGRQARPPPGPPPSAAPPPAHRSVVSTPVVLGGGGGRRAPSSSSSMMARSASSLSSGNAPRNDPTGQEEGRSAPPQGAVGHLPPVQQQRPLGEEGVEDRTPAASPALLLAGPAKAHLSFQSEFTPYSSGGRSARRARTGSAASLMGDRDHNPTASSSSSSSPQGSATAAASTHSGISFASGGARRSSLRHRSSLSLPAAGVGGTGGDAAAVSCPLGGPSSSAATAADDAGTDRDPASLLLLPLATGAPPMLSLAASAGCGNAAAGTALQQQQQGGSRNPKRRLPAAGGSGPHGSSPQEEEDEAAGDRLGRHAVASFAAAPPGKRSSFGARSSGAAYAGAVDAGGSPAATAAAAAPLAPMFSQALRKGGRSAAGEGRGSAGAGPLPSLSSSDSLAAHAAPLLLLAPMQPAHGPAAPPALSSPALGPQPPTFVATGTAFLSSAAPLPLTALSTAPSPIVRDTGFSLDSQLAEHLGLRGSVAASAPSAPAEHVPTHRVAFYESQLGADEYCDSERHDDSEVLRSLGAEDHGGAAASAAAPASAEVTSQVDAQLRSGVGEEEGDTAYAAMYESQLGPGEYCDPAAAAEDPQQAGGHHAAPSSSLPAQGAALGGGGDDGAAAAEEGGEPLVSAPLLPAAVPLDFCGVLKSSSNSSSLPSSLTSSVGAVVGELSRMGVLVQGGNTGSASLPSTAGALPPSSAVEMVAADVAFDESQIIGGGDDGLGAASVTLDPPCRPYTAAPSGVLGGVDEEAARDSFPLLPPAPLPRAPEAPALRPAFPAASLAEEHQETGGEGSCCLAAARPRDEEGADGGSKAASAVDALPVLLNAVPFFQMSASGINWEMDEASRERLLPLGSPADSAVCHAMLAPIGQSPILRYDTAAGAEDCSASGAPLPLLAATVGKMHVEEGMLPGAALAVTSSTTASPEGMLLDATSATGAEKSGPEAGCNESPDAGAASPPPSPFFFPKAPSSFRVFVGQQAGNDPCEDRWFVVRDDSPAPAAVASSSSSVYSSSSSSSSSSSAVARYAEAAPTPRSAPSTAAFGSSPNLDDAVLFGIADGHGGHSMAQWAQTHLPRFVFRYTRQHQTAAAIAKGMQQAFLECNAKFTNDIVLKEAREAAHQRSQQQSSALSQQQQQQDASGYSQASSTQASFSGSKSSPKSLARAGACAIAVLVRRVGGVWMSFTANVGDTRSVLVRADPGARSSACAGSSAFSSSAAAATEGSGKQHRHGANDSPSLLPALSTYCDAWAAVVEATADGAMEPLRRPPSSAAESSSSSPTGAAAEPASMSAAARHSSGPGGHGVSLSPQRLRPTLFRTSKSPTAQHAPAYEGALSSSAADAPAACRGRALAVSQGATELLSLPMGSSRAWRSSDGEGGPPLTAASQWRLSWHASGIFGRQGAAVNGPPVAARLLAHFLVQRLASFGCALAPPPGAPPLLGSPAAASPSFSSASSSTGASGSRCCFCCRGNSCRLRLSALPQSTDHTSTSLAEVLAVISRSSDVAAVRLNTVPDPVVQRERLAAARIAMNELTRRFGVTRPPAVEERHKAAMQQVHAGRAGAGLQNAQHKVTMLSESIVGMVTGKETGGAASGIRVGGSLMTTRALGDGYLNHRDPLIGMQPWVAHAPYLSGVPEVRVRVLTSSDRFLVIGSDGVWENTSSGVAGSLVASFLADEGAVSSQPHPSHAPSFEHAGFGPSSFARLGGAGPGSASVGGMGAGLCAIPASPFSLPPAAAAASYGRMMRADSASAHAWEEGGGGGSSSRSGAPLSFALSRGLIGAGPPGAAAPPVASSGVTSLNDLFLGNPAQRLLGFCLLRSCVRSREGEMGPIPRGSRPTRPHNGEFFPLREDLLDMLKSPCGNLRRHDHDDITSLVVVLPWDRFPPDSAFAASAFTAVTSSSAAQQPLLLPSLLAGSQHFYTANGARCDDYEGVFDDPEVVAACKGAYPPPPPPAATAGKTGGGGAASYAAAAGAGAAKPAPRHALKAPPPPSAPLMPKQLTLTAPLQLPTVSSSLLQRGQLPAADRHGVAAAPTSASSTLPVDPPPRAEAAASWQASSQPPGANGPAGKRGTMLSYFSATQHPGGRKQPHK